MPAVVRQRRIVELVGVGGTTLRFEPREDTPPGDDPRTHRVSIVQQSGLTTLVGYVELTQITDLGAQLEAYVRWAS